MADWGVEWPSAAPKTSGNDTSARREAVGGTPRTPFTFLKRGSRKEPSALNRRSGGLTGGTPSSTTATPSSTASRLGGGSRMATQGSLSMGKRGSVSRQPAPWVGVGLAETEEERAPPRLGQSGQQQEALFRPIAARDELPAVRNNVWHTLDEDLGREDEREDGAQEEDRGEDPEQCRSPLALSEPEEWEGHHDADAQRRALMEFASLERRLIETHMTDDEEEEGQELEDGVQAGRGGRAAEGQDWMGLEDLMRGCSTIQSVEDMRSRPSAGVYGEAARQRYGYRTAGSAGHERSAVGKAVEEEREEEQEDAELDWMGDGAGEDSRTGGGLPWQAQEELERQQNDEDEAPRGAPGGKGPSEEPPVSGLVQRLFGQNKASTAPMPSSQEGGAAKGVGASSTTKCLGCSQKRATTLKVEQQLAELEQEVERVRKEKAAAAAAKEQHEKLLQQVKREKQQMLDWAESERRKVEKWTEEQRQAIAKEKKVAARQNARAAQLEELKQLAPTRQEKAEIEALKATIEKMKVEEEARKRKLTLTSRRQQTHAREQQKRIEELEAQVAALEHTRLEMLERTDLLERQLVRHAMAVKRANGPNSAAVAGARAAVHSEPNHKPRQQQQRAADEPRGHQAAHSRLPPPPALQDEMEGSNGLPGSLNTSASSAGHKRKRGILPLHLQQQQHANHFLTDADGSFSAASLSGGQHDALLGEHDLSHSSLHSQPDHVDAPHLGSSFPSPLPQYDPAKYTQRSSAQQPSANQRAASQRRAQPKTTANHSLGTSLQSSQGEAAQHATSFGSSGSMGHQQAARTWTENGRLHKQFGDGRLAIWYPNGTYKQIFPDSRTVVRFSNGDVKTSVPSTGTVMYYYAAAKTTQTSYKDGLEVFEFPSGQVEKHFPDGTKEITHAGGKTIMRQEQSASHTLGGSHGNGKARTSMNAMPRAAYAPAE